MVKLVNWAKHNKLSIILAVALLYVFSRNILPNYNGSPSISNSLIRGESMGPYGVSPMGIAKISNFADSYAPSPAQDISPTTGSDRLIIKDTSLSLVTPTVDQTITQIEAIAIQAGGYMVNSNLSIPEGAASGSITVRVPTTKRPEVLNAIKKTGTKIVSESVSGHDVTDQYVDLDTRLQNLNATKSKFEAILDQATSVPQILEVTRELTNIQTQIDNLKGQQLYLEKSSETSKISINLSTDELALPYTPDQAWRPQVVVKQAIRSLIGTLRGLGTGFIWLVVYAPIWITIAVVTLLIKRKKVHGSHKTHHE